MRLIECVDFNSITCLLAENPLIPSLYFSITDLDGNTIASTRWQKVCSGDRTKRNSSVVLLDL